MVCAAHVDDHDLAAEVGPGFPHVLLRTQGVGRASLHHRGQPAQRLVRGRTARAVGWDAEVALELPQAGLGLGTEVAVDAADAEAEVEQTALQGVDVVAGDEAARQVGQDPVTELPPSLVETSEGERADDAVDRQAALLLEGAYG